MCLCWTELLVIVYLRMSLCCIFVVGELLYHIVGIFYDTKISGKLLPIYYRNCSQVESPWNYKLGKRQDNKLIFIFTGKLR